MLKRILATILAFTASFVAADDPRLFIGVNIGSSLVNVAPATATSSSTTTALTSLLGGTGAAGATEASYNKSALLEPSSVLDSFILINPTLGMTFPITGRLQLEGYAKLDAREKEFKVQKFGGTDQSIALISREIGIGGSLMMRISKQYSVGPVVEATILTNKSSIHTSASEKDYRITEIGLQSVYRFHEYFSIGIACTTALDQKIKVLDPAGTTLVNKDLELEYKVAKAAISLRLTPI